ncbi:MAG: CHAT domain-containing protein [Phaeodactylibacter sp.]|nr:CHAT domain-containing protein [Phaeodactylibacter sp.]MCB9049758.1 CHAT domain-containing protein [Lewinellaceae bacterium]
MNSEKPVVFLAFANEYEAERRLDNIVKEREQLESILNEAYRNGLCDKPVVRQNVSIKTFLDVLSSDEYKNRIAIIHYGGHADGYQLLLEGLDGKRQVAKGDGLVNILAMRENQENLKLVFLNGCSTERLAKALTDRGVPIVIGTSTSIKDDAALTVATRFYTGLANGLTMAGAWADAKNEVESVQEAEDTVKATEKNRGIVLPEEAADSFPWEESFRDNAAAVDFKNWNLPEISKNPLFNLPPLDKTQLPASPFLFLKPYEARHAEIFFGRSKYIRDLWLKVNERNAPSIIMLYGESGAGKSSLLDAGLRPRLDAAKNKDGSKRFEVLYMRRDQEEGLVRTLAKMLSYRPEEQSEEEEPTDEPEEDPNLEKLEKIEAIASELEEEAANTFRSIIDRYRAIRAYKPGKQGHHGLYQENANGGLTLDKQAGARLRKAWIKLEKETGREVILILDQVEEAITQPNPTLEKELEELLRVLKGIFVRPATDKREKIKGKIILGYREEFNAKILARSQDYELSPSTVFLEQLRSGDIEEIFRELPRLRGINYYNLTVEKGLPERIASDLLKSRSAVAPVLQLMLTKLWEHTYDPDKNSAHFSVEAYNETQGGGKEMEKYFWEQMEAVRKWKPEAVESGLVLDMLQFHVTELGTSRRRDFKNDIWPRYRHLEEEEEYGHPQGFVEELIKKLKSPEIFLLNDEGRGYTSLPHDTLAPVVRREYDRSDKLGQRSARILEVKKPDLERAEEEEALRKLRLNDNDLDVVWNGKKGMRNLNSRERALLQISRIERDKRLRQRRAWAKAGIVGGLFILALSILAAALSVSVNEQLNEQVVSKALDASLIEQDKNPDNLENAIQLGQFAYNKNPTRRVDVVNNLYNLYGKDPNRGAEGKSGPLSFSLKPGGQIDALDYGSSTGPFLVHYKDSLVKYWTEAGREQTIHLGGPANDPSLKLEVGLSADGNKVQAISYYYREPRYIADGELVDGPWMLVYAPPIDEYGQAAPESNQNYTYLGYYDFLAGKLVDEYGRSYTETEFLEEYGMMLPFDLDGEYTLNVNTSDSDTLLSFTPIRVDSLFSFALMNERSRLLDSKRYSEIKKRDWWDAVSGKLDYLGTDREIPLRKTNLAWSGYNNIRTWDPSQPGKSPDSLGIDRALLYFQAISENRFLAVDTSQELVLLNANGGQLEAISLLPAQAGLLDLAISPNHQHIFAMTNEWAFICGLDGNLVATYYHENISSYSFSNDGYRLLTVSEDTVKVITWQPGNPQSAQFTYSPTQDTTLPAATRIAMARFHENEGYLVIGLESRAPSPRIGGVFNWLKSFVSSSKNKKGEQPIKARIVFWDYQREKQPKVSFECPNGRLYDATISRDGQYATALQAGVASIIPQNRGALPNDAQMATIEAANSKNPLHRGASQVWLSPGGKYIVRQSPDALELFTPSGERTNAYRFQNGYQPGFNGQVFTSDDYFLISEKSDEVFFWHPDDQEIRNWSNDYELFLSEKRDYELTTFMDEIPGSTDTAKWWALRVLLASLIFILLYYADFIIRAIQEKKYLEPASYFVGFSLFSLILALLWIEGSYVPDIRKAVFYSIAGATLALLAIGIYGFRKKLSQLQKAQKGQPLSQQLKYWINHLPKYGTLIIFVAVGFFVLYGLMIFLRIENAKQVNWDALLTGILIPIAGGALIGYPIHRLIQAYRAGNFKAFYHWLLLPVGFVSSIFWAVYGATVDNGYGDSIAGLLGILAIAVLLWAIIRRSRSYFRRRQYISFTTYAVPVAGILFLMVAILGDTSLGVLFALALPTAFISGRQQAQNGNYRIAFFLYTTAILLLAGALFWFGFSMNESIGIGLALTPVLVFIFYGLRRQLKNRNTRITAGKWAWPNWLAILGLWAVSLFSTAVFTGAMIDSAYALEDDYEEYPFYDEAEEQAEESPYSDDVSTNETEQEGNLTDEAEGYAPDSLPAEEAHFEPDAPAKADFDAPVLNNRQKLIVRLFAPDAITRERAREELENYWVNDHELIPELIQYSTENPEKEEGILEALALLAVQSDQLLKSNRSLLYTYLDWVSGKELGIDAEGQIQQLMDRMEH